MNPLQDEYIEYYANRVGGEEDKESDDAMATKMFNEVKNAKTLEYILKAVGTLDSILIIALGLALGLEMHNSFRSGQTEKLEGQEEKSEEQEETEV